MRFRTLELIGSSYAFMRSSTSITQISSLVILEILQRSSCSPMRAHLVDVSPASAKKLVDARQLFNCDGVGRVGEVVPCGPALVGAIAFY